MEIPGWLQAYIDALRGNSSFMTLAYLGVAAVVIFLLVWFFQPAPRQEKTKEVHKGRVRGKATVQSNPTNGMVTPELSFPVIARLIELDEAGRETDRVGHSIRVGSQGPVFLFLEGAWHRLDPISSLHREQMEEVRRQIGETGEFSLQLTKWKLEERLLFRGELLAGQIFSFNGGKGFFELMTATSPKFGEDNAIVLEKTIDEFQRAINEIWTLHTLVPSSFEEVTEHVGREDLKRLGLAA